LHGRRTGRPASDHPTLARAAASAPDTYARDQFAFALEIFIAGVEAVVVRRASTYVPLR